MDTKEGLLNKIAQTATARPLLEFYELELKDQLEAYVACKDKVMLRQLQGKCQWLKSHIAAFKHKTGV